MEGNLLKGKSCFITGASGGIGKEIALSLARQGVSLFLTGRNKRKLKSLKSKILGIRNHGEVFYCAADLNKEADIYNTINRARKSLKRIDILVNCAGIFSRGKLTKSTLAEFNQCFNINLKAPFILCNQFSKGMVKNKWGRIINIGSSSAYAGYSGTSIYCASKHAILGFSRSIYNELRGDNVRVHCISPAGTKTKMGKLIKDQDYKTFLEPKEIARFITSLISYDGNMVSEEIRLNRVRL